MARRYISVDVDLCIDEFEDEDLIAELKYRGNISSIPFNYEHLIALNHDDFKKTVDQMVYQLDTQKVSILQEAVKNSYHYTFIKETQDDSKN